jgi:hypothetical protein
MQKLVYYYSIVYTSFMVNYFKIIISIFSISSFLIVTGCNDDNGTTPSSYAPCNILLSNLKIGFNRAQYLRIISGESCSETANEKTNPILKLILLDEEDNERICTAIMLSKKQGLTAWHCFEDEVFRAFIELPGNNNQRIEITKVSNHPLVEDRGDIILHDLSVFEIGKEIEVTRLPIDPTFQVENGEKLYIYGFGRASGSVPDSAGILRGGITVVTGSDENFIRALYTGQDDAQQNACVGDSGGPAFVIRNDILQLVGVTSTGSIVDCGLGDESRFVNLTAENNYKFIASQVEKIDD